MEKKIKDGNYAVILDGDIKVKLTIKDGYVDGVVAISRLTVGKEYSKSITYKDGVIDGPYCCYNKDGTPVESGQFINGVLVAKV
jgi:antitoxin component YwqK of YwqJK toxin-antitoxin module